MIERLRWLYAEHVEDWIGECRYRWNKRLCRWWGHRPVVELSMYRLDQVHETVTCTRCHSLLGSRTHAV